VLLDYVQQPRRSTSEIYQITNIRSALWCNFATPRRALASGLGVERIGRHRVPREGTAWLAAAGGGAASSAHAAARHDRQATRRVSEADGILARTARGAGWVVAWRLGSRLIGIGSTLVLVRLLEPADFGLFALAIAVVGGLDLCLELGAADQIIRSRDPRPVLYDTAFTLGLLRGLVVMLGVAAAAAPVAALLGEARLEPVLLALAGTTLLGTAASIRIVDLRRELRFEREFVLLMVPRLLALPITIGGALLLESHWALVAGVVAQRVAYVALSYVMQPYRPRLTLAARDELLRVSLWAWAVNIVIELRDRMDPLLVGAKLGAAPAGSWAIGAELATLPTTELVEPVARAAMPGFAEILRSGSEQAAAEAQLRITALSLLVTLPAGVGLSLVAGPLVALAYGQAWLPAVPVVAVLGVAAAIAPVGSVCTALLTAKARLRRLLVILGAAAALKAALLLALTGPLGLLGAALAVAAAQLAENAALMLGSRHLLGPRPTALLRATWRPLAATAAMAAVLWGAGLGWAPPPAGAAAAAVALLAGVAAGMAVFGAVLLLLWLASGRPQGTETGALAMLHGLRRR
jgi:O-antigen/teichoic acid export membrane protein